MQGNHVFFANTPEKLNGLTRILYLHAVKVRDKSFETVGNVTRPTSGTANYATDDFVFGSYQLADTGSADNDSRMFFDKSKSAFRAGFVNTTQWDDANVGTGSVATGSQLQRPRSGILAAPSSSAPVFLSPAPSRQTVR